MAIFDLFSRRKKRAENADPDPYQYDVFPEPLRIQVTYIWESTIGRWSSDGGNSDEIWNYIYKSLWREKGLPPEPGYQSSDVSCREYLRNATEVDDILDLIEMSFKVIEYDSEQLDDYARERRGITQSADDAIHELNFRFREASLGYQFESGQIIRVDSELMHSEVVLPALRLLRDPRFKGAEEEYLSAHAHYRAGEYKDCTSDALNALESTMKSICDLKGWKYDKGATASVLLKVLRDNDLLPVYHDKSFDHLVATLKTSLPPVRNNEGGHGQGSQPKATPPYIAAYALHLAAAKIVLLVEASKAKS